jgi:hypothetical protein
MMEVACFLGAPSALCGSRDCLQGRFRFTCNGLQSIVGRLCSLDPTPFETLKGFGSLTDISGKVCQGFSYP